MKTPKLTGSNLEQHFEQIANDAIGHHIQAADSFSPAPIPPPNKIRLVDGWVKYTTPDNGKTWKTQKVEFPVNEPAYVFDTETFVKKGGYPVIGTAVGSSASYVWLAKEMVDPDLPESEWTSYDLIPLGKGSLVIGHFISYDRIRTSTDYNLEPEISNFYFDTLSAHVAVSGISRKQSWLHRIKERPTQELSPSDRKLLKRPPLWLSAGAGKSLVKAYNFYVDPENKLNQEDKTIRDDFVNANSIHELAKRRDLIYYGLQDSYYTAELFVALWPEYKLATPSSVGLASQYYINSSKIPLTADWKDWVNRVEKQYEVLSKEASDILLDLIKQYVGEWQKYLKQDIEAILPVLVKECNSLGIKTHLVNGNQRPEAVLLKNLIQKGFRDWLQKSDEFIRKDPWLRQLDWTPKSFEGKYKNLPVWAHDYLTRTEPISTKTPCAGLLLKLEWEKYPVTYTRKDGYGFIDDSGSIKKIPHPKGSPDNVGSLLSKDFMGDMEVGRLYSKYPGAKRALEIAKTISTWVSIRGRVMSRIVKNNVMLPRVIAHGTITRRTSENLWLTSSGTKPYLLGSEIKTRIESPDGWKIVGSDFDSQELHIASLYADCWANPHNPTPGSTPLSKAVLSGSKADGTDPHTALAKAIGIDRDTAKTVNFGILYGGGAKTIANSIKKANKDRTHKELLAYATKAIKHKKGKMNGDEGIYEGGTDSECFNFMNSLATGHMKLGKSVRDGIPTLPVLGTKITTSLRPGVVKGEFYPCRINWTIQAAGAELLAIYLVAIHWLAEKAHIPMQFVLSIHDEVWFMVPEQKAQSFAVLVQLAHKLTWERFYYGLGLKLSKTQSFFSDVHVDNRVRKSPTAPTTTISHDGSLEPDGEAVTVEDMFNRGWVKEALRSVTDG